MKTILILSALLIGAFCATSVEEQLFRDVYTQWKMANKKVYYSGYEDELRFNIFVKNYMIILSNNAQNSTVELGLNQFADLTSEEFAATYTGYIPRGRDNALPALKLNVTADRVDWREKGAVTDVKNQASCGSCWAFSAVGALEALYYINNGKLLSFSEQQVVDCDTRSHGCSGGWMSWAFDYTAKSGLELGSDYPYVARKQNCAAVASKTMHVNSAYRNVTARNVDALKAAIAQQPVSVAIQADQSVFQLYKAGVIVAGCGASLNHGVLAVGFDTFVGVEGFIVKNSWGATWGNKGYVLIGTSASANNGAGVCGILADSCYPIY